MKTLYRSPFRRVKSGVAPSSRQARPSGVGRVGVSCEPLKPADRPDYYAAPAPEGRSRESTIVLDPNGFFFHEGERVEPGRIASALHTWISRHPDNGRFILDNGYDWTYFTVLDSPYVVTSVDVAGDDAYVTLSDGTAEPLYPARLSVDPAGLLRMSVKASARGGPFNAKFSRFAQNQVAPLLMERPDGLYIVSRLGEARVG